VVTSVTRDDLPDNGARAFADTVGALKRLTPAPSVELLIPDLLGADLEHVIDAGPDVLAHNVEVVARLTPQLRHGGFSYDRSLDVLRQAKGRCGTLVTKSSIMLGLGEKREEVVQTMRDLRGVHVDILVLGQYLRPTRTNTAVREYVHPQEFSLLASQAEALGFGYVAARPLARTSYKALEAFARHMARDAGSSDVGAGR
jgi:lipoic acid synthetase